MLQNLPSDVLNYIYTFHDPYREYFSNKVIRELNWTFVKCYFCNRHVILSVETFNRNYIDIVSPPEILFHIRNRNYVDLKKLTITVSVES
jgi:hypothetical protein